MEYDSCLWGPRNHVTVGSVGVNSVGTGGQRPVLALSLQNLENTDIHI